LEETTTNTIGQKVLDISATQDITATKYFLEVFLEVGRERTLGTRLENNGSSRNALRDDPNNGCGGDYASCRYNFLKRISPIIPASNGIVLGSQGIIIIFPS